MMDEIIKKVSALFLKYGIKSVSMDDISRELGISKKTLYQYFKDKDDLVSKSILFHIREQECDMDSLYDPSLNAIDMLLIVSKYLTDKISQLNPSVNYDLQKYYPESWKLILNYRTEHIFEKIKNNLEKGIQEGIYRENINIDIISKLYVSRIELAIEDQEWFQKQNYSYDEVFKTVFEYHIRGIANQNGLKYYESKVNL